MKNKIKILSITALNISFLKAKPQLIILLLGILLSTLLYPVVATCYFILTHSRSEVINYGVDLLEKKHLYPVINEIYTPFKHQLFKWLAAGCYVFILTGIISVFRNRKQLSDKIIFWGRQVGLTVLLFFKKTIPEKTIYRYIFLGLFISGLIVCTYFICITPVSFDEADTWLLFIAKGPIFISSFYPFPNNHIFYNWCVWLHSFIPLSPSYLLRLPLFPSFITTFFLFYRYSKTIYNESVGLMATGIFIFSCPFLQYNHLGRGYLFVLMFGLVILYALKKAELGFRKKYRYAVFFSIFLGTYSVPSFIYFLIPVLLYYLYYFFINNRRDASALLRISCVSMLIILLAYAPVMLVSGNYNFFRQYNPIEWERVPLILINFHTSIYNFIFGYSPIKHIIVCLLLIGIIKGIINKKNKWFSILSVFVFLIPYLFFILQRQIFPPRIFIHLIIFSSIIIGALIVEFKKDIYIFLSLILFCPLYLYNSSIRNPELVKYDELNRAAALISKKIIQENKRIVFFRKAYLKPLIEYHAKINNHDIVLLNEKGPWKKNRFDPAFAYDVIVWPRNDPSANQVKFALDTVYAGEKTIITFRKN